MVEPDHKLDVLCVCTHNRTRSVLMKALLGGHLDDAGVPNRIWSAGLHGNGGRATDGALQHLAMRGFDVSDHASHLIDADDVARADLIVTAEKLHVAEIAGVWHDAFESTFTLPELIHRSGTIGARGTLGEWLVAVNRDRPTALDYLDADIGEIPDPTGESPAHWRTSVNMIDDLTKRLATTLAELDLAPALRSID